jgi:hypothetical protein
MRRLIAVRPRPARLKEIWLGAARYHFRPRPVERERLARQLTEINFIFAAPP